ncbi:MAG: hypothetical protein HYZ37_12850, partial [Candidatus Solibacter usitatus]|nr:hypothetical protein [Candidatus Solibacter usitatus]
MALASDVKQKVISEYRLHDDDVGSPEVQVAVLKLIVGTHAVIQHGVHFARLGLAVVDEQHRFGVAQRLAL